MPKPKLSTKTPDAPETNALIPMHDQIIALPRERRYAVVELGVKGINTDVATGDQQATVLLTHIEIPSDQAKLEKMIDDEFTSRTKIKTRPDPTAETDTPLEGIGGLDDSVTDK